MSSSISHGDFLVVLCTCPNAEVAQTLAELVVDQHLAACVNIMPGITSVYRWENAITSSTEHLLVIKTRSSIYPALETVLVKHHPYKIPEVIAFSVVCGLPAYLNWINDSIDYGEKP